MPSAAGAGRSGNTACSSERSVTAFAATSRARSTPRVSMIQVIGTASGAPKPLLRALAASTAG